MKFLNYVSAIFIVFTMVTTSAWAAKVVEIEIGESKLVNLRQDIQSVYVVESAIADAQTPSHRSLLIYGKSFGETDVVAIDENGKALVHYRVKVQNSNLSHLRRYFKNLYPEHPITLNKVGHAISVKGEVESAEMARDILKITSEYARSLLDKEMKEEMEQAFNPDSAGQQIVRGPGGQAVLPLVIDRLTIEASPQVNISIRIVEMARSTSEELGVRWQAVDPDWMLGVVPGNQFSTGIDITDPDQVINHDGVFGILDALAQKSLVNVLAEPNLTAKSGEKAEFLVGGEFPFPSLDGDGVTVDFKQFGVGLSVTPTVMSKNRISLSVTPVVSALSRQNSIRLAGVVIPGLDTRTATTTVELADGQSFALAGLLRTSEENSVDAIPFLGEIPGLGALFRSTTTNQVERELVIIATASLVKPVSDIDSIPTPLDQFRSPTRFERLFFGDIESEEETPRLLGDYGYRY